MHYICNKRQWFLILPKKAAIITYGCEYKSKSNKPHITINKKNYVTETKIKKQRLKEVIKIIMKQDGNVTWGY